jgi:hypothetical protein
MSVSKPVVKAGRAKQNKVATLRARPASLNSEELTAQEEALIAELDPQSGIQRFVAQNLARNESEIQSLSARKTLIFWDMAAREMRQELMRHLDQSAAEACARAWGAGQSEASAEIAALGIDPEQVLNVAFITAAPVISLIETQIDRLERRRRQLHEEFRNLKDRTPIPAEIEDAEVLRDVG